MRQLLIFTSILSPGSVVSSYRRRDGTVNMFYLHALHFSTIARQGGNVIVGLSCARESRSRFETSEGCDHASLSRGDTVDCCHSGGGNQGSHCPFSFPFPLVFLLRFSEDFALLLHPIYKDIYLFSSIHWTQAFCLAYGNISAVRSSP